MEDNPHHIKEQTQITQIQAKHFKAMQGNRIHNTQHEHQTAQK